MRVPVPNARLNLCRKAADLSAHVSTARPQTARGNLHVPLAMSESVKVREEKETISPSRPRVPVPNARLNLRRKAAGLVLRMFRLHEQRPREDVGCTVE